MEPLLALAGSAVRAAGALVRDLLVLFSRPVGGQTADGGERDAAGAGS